MMKLWNRLFLDERPSIGLSFFRIFVALTTGFHVIPTFFQMDDLYLQTGLKSVNPQFFTLAVLEFVAKSPDAVVIFFAWAFCISCFFFLIGLWSQLSCLAMFICCYYFYALNDLHIGTLSWDILLVTLFLMGITGYHGDYFSVDALRRGQSEAYKTPRPFFIQRLLQLQIASTYFYTALYKVTAQGNWLKDNPMHYLMNYPPEGVTKFFLLKDWLASQPAICYWAGIAVIVFEFSMPLLLFLPKTRMTAIYLGLIFHIGLILTLDVPAIFFFLFPAQLLLFIPPQNVVAWIEDKRKVNAQSPRNRLVYDGHCQFCQRSVRQIRVMDLFATLDMVDLHGVADLSTLHPALTKEAALSQLHLIEPNGEMSGGFDVFRRLCFTLPMLYVTAPIVYFPGMGVVGPWVYRWVAKNRYLFHFNQVCKDNACFINRR